MALTRFCAVAFMAVAAACGRPAPPDAPADDLTALSVTRWTDRTELFAEYPPLVAGETSRFAIHLTRLDTFAPLGEGQVEVRLDGGGAPEVFRAAGPSRPGIFGVDVKPARSGPRELTVVLRAAGLQDEHRLGRVDVHTDREAVLAAPEEEDEGSIHFLKEQQWTLDFGTVVVRELTVRESIRVPALLEPRPGGAADVSAPIDGRLTRVLDAPPGTTVARGQELARLAAPPPVPGDLPQLQRARDEARSSAALATRDRERAERLVSAGAAPEKRLDEARSAEQQALARVRAADASLAQYDSARAGRTADTEGAFIIRAPLGGVIARRDAAAGANVTAGRALFRIVDAARVHVSGHVPEAQSARAHLATSAEIEVPGHEGRLPAGPLVAVGRVLDPESRSVPVTFAFDNRRFGFPVGQSVFLHLLLDPAAPAPAVPASAVVDDAGRPVVYVQRTGETFERRAVTPGPRTGDVVQVLDGVKPGERVVARGAYLVRLASLSPSAPAHGHVH